MQIAKSQSVVLVSSSVSRVRLWLFALAGFIYLADQASKLWVLRTLDHFDQIVVIPGFFHLVHVRNSGAAFGMLSEATPWLRATVLVGVSSVAVMALVYLVWNVAATREYGGAMLRTGLALILGGAAGNIHDRLAHGNVVDFLDFFIGSWHWYTFNVADSTICVGTALLLIDLWRKNPSPAS
ncbi:MAG: signal peptidase II [Bryobacterales bacterium]|nr:signal peptidase II [Bryobacterales bacterium]